MAPQPQNADEAPVRADIFSLLSATWPTFFLIYILASSLECKQFSLLKIETFFLFNQKRVQMEEYISKLKKEICMLLQF